MAKGPEPHLASEAASSQALRETAAFNSVLCIAFHA